MGKLKNGPEIKLKLKNKLGEYCCWCGAMLDFSEEAKISRPSNMATIEHVLPRSLGGKDSMDNFMLACYKCNHARGNGERPIFTERKIRFKIKHIVTLWEELDKVLA